MPGSGAWPDWSQTNNPGSDRPRVLLNPALRICCSGETAGPILAEALAARSEVIYVDPFEIGKTFARAGMVDEALHWLDKAADNGSYEITYIAFWP